MRLLFALLFLFSIEVLQGNFIFQDFNVTSGLIFNGAAGTTNCYNFTPNAYGTYQGVADVFDEPSAIERGETTVLISESTVQTNVDSDNFIVDTTLAGFLNKNDSTQSPEFCRTRLRLTPSNPSKAGAVWFADSSPVTNGFDTYFTFQITDHSKQCTQFRDQYFSQTNYRSCSIHGADGFAFVVQLSPNTTSALGAVGGQLGFGGIENSLAIAFDTWQNPGDDQIFGDHVSVQSRSTAPNNAFAEGLLGVPRTHKLADGQIHLARITYYGTLQAKYFNKLVASDSLLPYLKDNGEQKRVGTLAVFLDDGVANDDPLLALPINLSLLLKLPTDKAYAGFTSSTGRFYEKHDIISWVYCDQGPCDTPSVQEFDFHQQSRFSAQSKRQNFPPGEGYGGGDTSGFPTKNESPNTDPWFEPVDYFADGVQEGLSPNKDKQIPPNTFY